MFLLRLTMLLVAAGIGAGAAWIHQTSAPVIAPIVTTGAPSTPTDGRPATGDTSLIENGTDGPLPKVASDGRKPMSVYAARFDRGDKRPRIAVIVTDLGLRQEVSERAIAELPATVTLAFSPYGSRLIELSRKARQDGHEILVQLPIAGPNTALVDAGPQAVTLRGDAANNLKRLHWVMSRFTGYVGLIGDTSGKSGARNAALQPVWSDLAARGVLYVAGPDGPAPEAAGPPLVRAPLVLDGVPSRQEIEVNMRRAEEEAKRSGRVTVVAHPYPLTIQLVRDWLASLDRKALASAPVSALLTDGSQ